MAVILASQANADDRVPVILDVAERLFREIGYAKTTMADIAQELRLSSASIYRFFPSKAAINDAICRRMLAELHLAMRGIAAGPGDVADRIKALILGTYRLHRDMLTDARRVHEMVEAAMAESWDAVEEHKRVCSDIYAGLVQQGIDQGEFPAVDPDAVAEALTCATAALCHPTMIAQHHDPADPDPERSARRVAWLVVEGLRNPNRKDVP